MDFEYVLRVLAGQPPRSVALEFRWVFDPAVRDGDPQSRLQLFLIAGARTKGRMELLRTAITASRLNRFYALEGAQPPPQPGSAQRYACDIVRQHEVFSPTHGPEFNPYIPSSYLSIAPFVASDDNDYRGLVSVLGNIPEQAIISMTAEPVDTSVEFAAHAAYRAKLEHASHDRLTASDDESIEFLVSDDGRRRTSRPRRPQREDPLAGQILRGERRFQESFFRRRILRFHLRILAESGDVAHALGSVVAACAWGDGAYDLVETQSGDAEFARLLAGLHEHRVVPPASGTCAADAEELQLYRAMLPLLHCATVEELMGAFRLPVAGHSSPCCIRENSDPPSVEVRDLIVLGHDQDPEGPGAGPLRGVPVEHLLKGGFISGVPGSGKTTTIMNTTRQLSRWEIPFIVLEMAKKECRRWKRLRDHPDPDVRQFARELQVYTLGADESPLLFNPLEKLDGITRDSHIESLLECCRGTMPMFPAFPGILAETFERVFDEHAESDTTPEWRCLAPVARRVIADQGYSGSTRHDLEGATDLRLGLLAHLNPGKVFQCRRSVPGIERLVTGCSIVEFEALADDPVGVAGLLMLNRILDYFRVRQPSPDGPGFVIIIDEAHRLVGPNTNTSPREGMADPGAHVSNFVCRMLVELRALGVGVIIADQHASGVAPGVIRSTAWKLAFRQLESQERAEIGGAMSLGPTQIEELACLKTGEAFFFTEGYHAPRRIQTVDLFRELDQMARRDHR